MSIYSVKMMFHFDVVSNFRLKRNYIIFIISCRRITMNSLLIPLQKISSISKNLFE